MLLLFAVVALVAAVAAPSALAAKPTPDPNCTFEKGKTTCVEDAITRTYEITDFDYSYTVGCGFLNAGTRYVDVYDVYRADVYSKITTVYRGKTDTVLSTNTVYDRTEYTYLYSYETRSACDDVV